MRGLNLRFRVILVVALAYLAVFGILGGLSFQNSRDYLLQSEQQKLEVILETISPVLTLNMQLGLTGALGQPLENLHRHNSDLLASRIRDHNGYVLFVHGVDSHWQNQLDRPEKQALYSKLQLRSPLDEHTVLGTIDAIYSARNYEEMLRDHSRLTWQLGVLFLLALVAIGLYLAYAFLPLKRLAEALSSYHPGANRANLPAIRGDGELTTIVTAAEEMMARIAQHTDHLNELNATLEQKVATKTASLEQLNATLEARISEEVEKNRQKERVMFQQAKQAQMGEMIGMIAHQWRQPLSAIGTLGGNIRLRLSLGQNDKTAFYELLDRIDTHVQYLSGTVNDFRNLFNPNRRMEQVDLKGVIERATSILSSTLSHHQIELKLNLQTNELLSTYPNELLQVILSLIKNAIDALIDQKISNPCVMIEVSKSEDWYHLIISDNGSGVSAGLEDRIFEPYFTTKDTKNGTGLGLYMAKELVEQHCQGRIRLQNSSEGARFVIALPSQPMKEG